MSAQPLIEAHRTALKEAEASGLTYDPDVNTSLDL